MLIARLKRGWKHWQDVHSASTPHTPPNSRSTTGDKAHDGTVGMGVSW
jgi:hypothetical protein